MPNLRSKTWNEGDSYTPSDAQYMEDHLIDDEHYSKIDTIETGLSDHTSNKSNPHNITAAKIGLGNVNNTSDVDKPVSTAAQSALYLKANQSSLESEITRATTAEQANASAITAETTRATTAEQANASAITAETTRATSAEQANASAITTETTRATTSETALSDRIKQLERENRTGILYQVLIPKYSAGLTTSQCTKIGANALLTCVPSTDTVEGQDDYSDIYLFRHWDCNYTRDDDGTARPTFFKGMSGYATSGAVDVGVCGPTFWWGIEDYDDTQQILTMCDSPKDGLVPWCESVKADGTILPYWCHSKYASVMASDGKLRSQPNLPPVYNQSYNNMITNYRTKGAGYWGGGACLNAFASLFTMMKFATKNSQNIFKGCTSFNVQPQCSVAETAVKRVLTTDSGFYSGCCVSVGVINGTNIDRGYASMNSICDRVKVSSIETVTIDGTNYYALNLDIENTIDTTTDMYITSMPSFSGETDAVIGDHDGSYLSNTDGKHPFRIQGTEYMNGQYCVASDVVMEFQSDYSKNVYAAQKGTVRVADAYTGYKLIGNIPNKGTGADWWIGDEHYDTETCVLTPYSIGSSDATGTGDIVWAGGTSTSGVREYLMSGYLGVGLNAGLCYLHCRLGLSWASWVCGSRD